MIERYESPQFTGEGVLAKKGGEFPHSHTARSSSAQPVPRQTRFVAAQMDSCIEAFGTTKQKRALNSRRMNKVGSESLNCAVAKAAENIIDAKGVTGKQLGLGIRVCSQRLLPLLLRSFTCPTDGNNGHQGWIPSCLSLRASLGNRLWI